MAGSIRDSWGGEYVATDYLVPKRLAAVRCGPLDISQISTPAISCATLSVTGTATFAVPPYVPGPATHVWSPAGPTVVVGGGGSPVELARFALADGFWMIELHASACAGADEGFVCRLMGSASVASGVMTLPDGGIWDYICAASGTLMTTANTSVVLGTDAVLGVAFLTVSVLTPATANWTVYVRCTGAAPPP